MSWRFPFRRPKLAADFAMTAIISVYDDALYLERCFQNMAEHGVDAIVIDNDCLPETRDIVERHRGAVVREVVAHPRQGVFDWSGILLHKEEIANRMTSDWIFLWDSDEIRDAPEGHSSFREAIRAADDAGHTTVNFDEFVFVPTTESEDFTGGDYVENLSTYYYFAPNPIHRANGWRRPRGKSHLTKGMGHRVKFRGQSISPENFALRHYLFLSFEHGQSKYLTRDYSEKDIERHLSEERRNTTKESFQLPDARMMKRKEKGQSWDKSEPRSQHPSFVYTASPTADDA